MKNLKGQIVNIIGGYRKGERGKVLKKDKASGNYWIVKVLLNKKENGDYETEERVILPSNLEVVDA